MGRTSKRLYGKDKGKTQREIYKENVYQAGIYARLSSDQGQEKAASIETQVEISEKFVEKWNEHHGDKIVIEERYIDLGKTGTNFNRDAFERLMQSVRLGDINCIIVKDLSRFGRNYLEAGNYIEKIFPFLGVRFIAVSDGFDTASEENKSRQISAEIKNLIHEMYAKDSSKKAKLHLRQRREEGSYVGGPPPYGYRTAWEGRLRKLVPDDSTAEIVRYIFREFVEEQSYGAVVKELNKKRINPPSIYRKTGDVYCPEGTTYKGWDKGSVGLILRSENYIGKLIQGKTSIFARNEANRVYVSPSKWVIKEQAHIPLIEEGQFEEAARIRDMLRQKVKNQNLLSDGMPLEENIFDQVLYCGVCGHKMTRTSYVRQYADGTRIKHFDYICPNSGTTRTESCPDPNHIVKQNLEDILFVLLGIEFSIHIGRGKKYVEKGMEHVEKARRDLEKKRKLAENAIEGIEEEESEKYIAYRTGRIPEKEYAAFKMQKAQPLEELKGQVGFILHDEKELERKGERYGKAIRSLIRWNGKKELTKELVETLIGRIYIYPGKRAEVVFSYTDAFAGEEEAG